MNEGFLFVVRSVEDRDLHDKGRGVKDRQQEGYLVTMIPTQIHGNEKADYEEVEHYGADECKVNASLHSLLPVVVLREPRAFCPELFLNQHVVLMSTLSSGGGTVRNSGLVDPTVKLL